MWEKEQCRRGLVVRGLPETDEASDYYRAKNILSICGLKNSAYDPIVAVYRMGNPRDQNSRDKRPRLMKIEVRTPIERDVAVRHAKNLREHEDEYSAVYLDKSRTRLERARIAELLEEMKIANSLVYRKRLDYNAIKLRDVAPGTPFPRKRSGKASRPSHQVLPADNQQLSRPPTPQNQGNHMDDSVDSETNNDT